MIPVACNGNKVAGNVVLYQFSVHVYWPIYKLCNRSSITITVGVNVSSSNDSSSSHTGSSFLGGLASAWQRPQRDYIDVRRRRQQMRRKINRA